MNNGNNNNDDQYYTPDLSKGEKSDKKTFGDYGEEPAGELGTNEGGTIDENQVVDEDVESPPAGTPGHPGIDEGTG